MPAPWGLLSTGLSVKTQEDVEAGIRARIAAAPSLGANIDTEPESPMGQIVVILSAAIAELWSATEEVHGAADLDVAAGAALDALVQRYRITRQPATSSRVALTLAGTPATLIPAGSVVTLLDAGTRWVLIADATIGGGGTVSADFDAEETGPFAALAGSTWAISTPVSGWTGATNVADAALGEDLETDAALRGRARQSASTGSRSADAIRTAILQLAGVTEAFVIENDTLYTDADGRPAKSFEAVVRGGADAGVAAGIWATKPAGIESATTVALANQVSVVVTDGNGDPQTVLFSRPDLVSAYVELDYTPRLGVFPSNGEALMLQAVLDFGAGLRIGTGVTPEDIRQAVLCALPSQALRVLTLRLGTSPGPATAVEIPTSRTELASFDSSRVSITRV